MAELHDGVTLEGDIARRASRILEVAQNFADQVRREADEYAVKKKQDADDANVDIERMHADVARQHQLAVDLKEEAQRIQIQARIDADARMDEALVQANQITATAEQQANTALAEALAEADQITAAARDKADHLIARTEADAAQVRQQADNELAAARATIAA